MKFEVKPASVRFLEYSALGLILATIATTLIYKYFQVDMVSYFYGLIAIIAAVFLMIEIGVMHYFRASTYKKIRMHEIIGVVVSVISGVLLISGIVALPLWNYPIPVVLQGILLGTNIITGIVVVLSLIYVMLTK